MHSAGWYPDPRVAGAVRYWDGVRWTDHIAHRVPPPAPPHPELPLRMAVGALSTIFLSLVVSRFVLDGLSRFDWPIPAYIVVAGLVGYGPVVLFCWWASRTMGSGSFRADAGFFFRKADIGWGPATWLCCFGVQLALAVVIVTTHIPLTGNTEGVDDIDATRGYVISLLVLAVVAAPLIEEMVFRGVVLRGLLSRFGALPAIGIQGVVFGMAHFDPVRGAGNIGLIIILSGVGCVLGAAEHRFRRIGPTIIAHALINAIAMTVALSGLASS